MIRFFFLSNSGVDKDIVVFRRTSYFLLFLCSIILYFCVGVSSSLAVTQHQDLPYAATVKLDDERSLMVSFPIDLPAMRNGIKPAMSFTYKGNAGVPIMPGQAPVTEINHSFPMFQLEGLGQDWIGPCIKGNPSYDRVKFKNGVDVEGHIKDESYANLIRTGNSSLDEDGSCIHNGHAMTPLYKLANKNYSLDTAGDNHSRMVVEVSNENAAGVPSDPKDFLAFNDESAHRATLYKENIGMASYDASRTAPYIPFVSARQSSDYSTGTFKASAGIDGDPDTFTHTKDGRVKGWWIGEFRHPTNLERLTVYNRYDKGIGLRDRLDASVYACKAEGLKLDNILNNHYNLETEFSRQSFIFEYCKLTIGDVDGEVDPFETFFEPDNNLIFEFPEDPNSTFNPSKYYDVDFILIIQNDQDSNGDVIDDPLSLGEVFAYGTPQINTWFPTENVDRMHGNNVAYTYKEDTYDSSSGLTGTMRDSIEYEGIGGKVEIKYLYKGVPMNQSSTDALRTVSAVNYLAGLEIYIGDLTTPKRTYHFDSVTNDYGAKYSSIWHCIGSGRGNCHVAVLQYEDSVNPVDGLHYLKGIKTESGTKTTYVRELKVGAHVISQLDVVGNITSYAHMNQLSDVSNDKKEDYRYRSFVNGQSRVDLAQRHIYDTSYILNRNFAANYNIDDTFNSYYSLVTEIGRIMEEPYSVIESIGDNKNNSGNYFGKAITTSTAVLKEPLGMLSLLEGYYLPLRSNDNVKDLISNSITSYLNHGYPVDAVSEVYMIDSDPNERSSLISSSTTNFYYTDNLTIRHTGVTHNDVGDDTELANIPVFNANKIRASVTSSKLGSRFSTENKRYINTVKDYVYYAGGGQGSSGHPHHRNYISRVRGAACSGATDMTAYKYNPSAKYPNVDSGAIEACLDNSHKSTYSYYGGGQRARDFGFPEGDTSKNFNLALPWRVVQSGRQGAADYHSAPQVSSTDDSPIVKFVSEIRKYDDQGNALEIATGSIGDDGQVVGPLTTIVYANDYSIDKIWQGSTSLPMMEVTDYNDYDIVFGNYGKVVHPSGEEITSTFDSFGRYTGSTSTSGIETSYHIERCADVSGSNACPDMGTYIPEKVEFRVTIKQTHSSDVFLYLNLRGQVRRAQTEMYIEDTSNKKIVMVDKEYESTSFNLKSVTGPYTADMVEVARPVVKRYTDRAGRNKKVVNPSRTITRSHYSATTSNHPFHDLTKSHKHLHLSQVTAISHKIQPFDSSSSAGHRNVTSVQSNVLGKIYVATYDLADLADDATDAEITSKLYSNSATSKGWSIFIYDVSPQRGFKVSVRKKSDGDVSRGHLDSVSKLDDFGNVYESYSNESVRRLYDYNHFGLSNTYRVSNVTDTGEDLISDNNHESSITRNIMGNITETVQFKSFNGGPSTLLAEKRKIEYGAGADGINDANICGSNASAFIPCRVTQSYKKSDGTYADTYQEIYKVGAFDLLDEKTVKIDMEGSNKSFTFGYGYDKKRQSFLKYPNGKVVGLNFLDTGQYSGAAQGEQTGDTFSLKQDGEVYKKIEEYSIFGGESISHLGVHASIPKFELESDFDILGRLSQVRMSDYSTQTPTTLRGVGAYRNPLGTTNLRTEILTPLPSQFPGDERYFSDVFERIVSVRAEGETTATIINDIGPAGNLLERAANNYDKNYASKDNLFKYVYADTAGGNEDDDAISVNRLATITENESTGTNKTSFGYDIQNSNTVTKVTSSKSSCSSADCRPPIDSIFDIQYNVSNQAIKLRLDDPEQVGKERKIEIQYGFNQTAFVYEEEYEDLIDIDFFKSWTTYFPDPSYEVSVFNDGEGQETISEFAFVPGTEAVLRHVSTADVDRPGGEGGPIDIDPNNRLYESSGPNSLGVTKTNNIDINGLGFKWKGRTSNAGILTLDAPVTISGDYFLEIEYSECIKCTDTIDGQIYAAVNYNSSSFNDIPEQKYTVKKAGGIIKIGPLPLSSSINNPITLYNKVSDATFKYMPLVTKISLFPEPVVPDVPDVPDVIDPNNRLYESSGPNSLGVTKTNNIGIDGLGFKWKGRTSNAGILTLDAPVTISGNYFLEIEYSECKRCTDTIDGQIYAAVNYNSSLFNDIPEQKYTVKKAGGTITIGPLFLTRSTNNPITLYNKVSDATFKSMPLVTKISLFPEPIVGPDPNNRLYESSGPNSLGVTKTSNIDRNGLGFKWKGRTSKAGILTLDAPVTISGYYFLEIEYSECIRCTDTIDGQIYAKVDVASSFFRGVDEQKYTVKKAGGTIMIGPLFLQEYFTNTITLYNKVSDATFKSMPLVTKISLFPK